LCECYSYPTLPVSLNFFNHFFPLFYIAPMKIYESLMLNFRICVMENVLHDKEKMFKEIPLLHPSNGRRDTDEKVLWSPSKVPFLIGRLQRNLYTL
jgi:hypothetical protein